MELKAKKSKFNDALFVHLTKNKRFICFSENVWSKLLAGLDSMTVAFKAEKYIKLELTNDFTVETLPFQGKFYACFKKKNLYINLDATQWENFQKEAITVLSGEDKENIPPEPTVTRYLYVTEHPPKFFFSKTLLKDYAENQGLPYQITEKKVPAPDKNRLCQLVRAHMTKKQLSELVKEHCYGCQYDMPGQRDHNCLEEDAEDNYWHLVSLKNVSENVRKVVQALGLSTTAYSPTEESTAPVLETIPEDFQDLFRQLL